MYVESLMIGNLIKDEVCDVGERIRVCFLGVLIFDNSWLEICIVCVF